MISVILVSYNKPNLLRETLLSLKAHHQENLEIIIVDNSEKKDVEFLIKSEFPEVVFKKMDTNIGFGKANNIGFQMSTGEYIALLNNDLVFQENVLSTLVKQLEEDQSLGVIGPKLLNEDKSLQYSCCNFPSVCDIIKAELWGDYSVQNWYLTNWEHDQKRSVGYVSGALMVLRRDLFEKIGLFDNMYFMYSEEVDLCYRIKKAGYRIEYNPNVKAIHLGGASANLKNREINTHLYLSRLKFRLKHYGFLSTLFQILGITAVSVMRCIFVCVKILIIRKNKDLLISHLIRTLKKCKLMFFYLIILISKDKNYFFRLHANG